MIIFSQNIFELILMLILLFFSAFFSGSETALFNLSRRQLNLLKSSPKRFEKLTASLMKTPDKVLGCVLFGNMIVNILFFAISSVFAAEIKTDFGITAAAFTAFVSFTLVLLVGEIFPKSVAYNNSYKISVLTALPVYILMKAANPVIIILKFIFVEPSLRLILTNRKYPHSITADEFKTLIEKTRRTGLISEDENKLISGIVEFGFLKVRDCLRPRVDMISCDVRDTNENIRKVMHDNHLTKIPVYVDNIDNIIGLIYLRHLILNPQTKPDGLVQKVNFVPEQKTIESLLDFFHRNKTDIAMAVDEYGGISGSIYLEDIAQQILGPIEKPLTGDPVKQIGPFEYRIAGGLSIHDWAEAFGIEPSDIHVTTISGLVTAILGKIPAQGDRAEFRNIEFTVEKVEKRRILTIILKLKAIPETKND
ncbi:MAG: HlyC/CorC family transporter [Phycisphaerae bacterium]|nr:HlyC/CorC family transporter [Phycisphaerae bacterium]